MVTYLRQILMSSMPQKKSPKTLPMPQYSPLIKFSMERRLSLMTLTRAQNELSRTLPMPQFTSAETFTMERRLSSKTSTRVQSESSLTLTDLQNMSPLEATISESGPSWTRTVFARIYRELVKVTKRSETLTKISLMKRKREFDNVNLLLSVPTPKEHLNRTSRLTKAKSTYF